MREGLVRSLSRIMGVASVLALTASGCFCSISDDDGWFGGGGGWGECSGDGDCFEGCVCVDGGCIETGWCESDADCMDGAACDASRNTCGAGPGGGGATASACGDDQCPEGCWFDASTSLCVETMFCGADSDCDSGLACQVDPATCVPADRTCNDPASVPGECADELCPEGCYWNPVDGGCVETAVCTASGDPACFSDEYCDVDEQACIPVDRTCAAPAPDPQPLPCVYSADCPEVTECVDGVCVSPATTPGGGGTTSTGCTFNYECGTDGTCIDARCHENCADSSTCPIGQICDAGGVCSDDPMPTPECALSTDCDGGYCINATCYPGCVADSECGGGEFCKRNVCRPDHRARPQCLYNSECGAGKECTDGVCRLRCWGDEWCAPLGPTSVCDVAWCTFPEESAANCSPDVPCAAGLSCVNGSCQ